MAAEADEEPDTAGEDDHGPVGARFGTSARKRKRAARDPDPVAAETPDPDPDQAEFDGYDDAPGFADLPDDPELWGDADWMARPESHTLVRPYAWTRGRTRTRADLAIEALVSTVAPDRATSWEHRSVTDLCAVPRSVAEVSALLNLPLGVARVLLADLAESGAVVVHARVGGDAPDLAFMGRVLAGLRKL
ncbi:hypothetical protein BJP25_04530 [Actinokineospora bangkokensis]|uniref:Multi-component regulatory system-8 n=1 Tax=Actinokineospora bangkokensis TaxID=1193682 RepID=A0A1Q9LE86_9PSEU|nr:hypothetical protein BJP25_04530 [Actinokineospora bangkokensis]